MLNKIDEIIFIPNWNGHLYLNDYKDNSVTLLYNKINFTNKKLLQITPNNPKETAEIISNHIKQQEKKDKLLFVTGDHSNTYTLFKEFIKQNNKNKNKNKTKSPKLVIFDAHPDVEVSTDMISHEDYLRNLIEEQIVKPQDVYLFGIRTFSRVEFDYLLKKGVNFQTISDILQDKKKIIDILKTISEDIYLSLDIDVLDPDVACGTYYKEWCGLQLDELLKFIEVISDKVAWCDICEYYFENDENLITCNNVIKLIESFVR